jgi:hypothetical protein
LSHSFDFGLCHAEAERSQAIVATPFVIQMLVRPLLGLHDQTLCEHSFNGSIEAAWAQVHFSAGALRDLAFDGIAVPFAVPESDQYVKNRWREGQKFFRVSIPFRPHVVIL